MLARHRNDRLVRLSVLTAVLAAGALWGVAPASAGELDKLDTALKLIPADAAFYSSMLRNREQFEALRKSNAWAKIEAMPLVQTGLAFYNMSLLDPDNPAAKFHAVFQNPEVQKIVDLAVDMASDEIFVYGDDQFVNFVELAQSLTNTMRFQSILADVGRRTGNVPDVDPGSLPGAVLMSALVEQLDAIKLPNLVIGFRVKNLDLAKEQLIKLETIGNLALESNERTKGCFKKTKVGDRDFLVVELDGGMIPWDEMPIDEWTKMEKNEGDLDKVIERVKESKLVVAIGLRDNYLLCSIGSSLEALEALGQGDRLIDRPEFQPLEKHADKRLVSIGYVSEALNRQMNDQRQQLDVALDTLDRSLPLAKLTDEQNQRIRKDAKAMADDLRGMMPEVGAMSALSFLDDRGVEGYQYNWGGNGLLDGSKPLTLFKHVGGSPILAIVFRTRERPANYDTFVKWTKTGYAYFGEFGLPNIPEPDRAKAEKFLAAAVPLCERANKATRELLVPALADGQGAMVIDGKFTTKRLHEEMPESEAPLPLPEPALVYFVNDAKLLKQAGAEYREVVNGLIDAVRRIEGSEVPEWLRIPEPTASETSAGTIYAFTLPKEWGLDAKIVPNIGVSNDTMALTASREHTERLLAANSPPRGGVLENTDKPLALAVWLDWAAAVDLAAPWIDFAIDQAMTENGADEGQRKMVADQAHTVLDVLKTLRRITDETYLEDDALVHHTLFEIRDAGN